MIQIQFPDKMVSYDTFLDDLASRVVSFIKQSDKDPEYISQRKAYALFGRGNVVRWHRQGKLNTRKRPGKIEYSTAELRQAQQTVQDYF